MRRLAVTLLAPALLAACAGNDPGWEPLPTAAVRPLTSVVIPYKETEERSSWLEYFNAALSDTHAHDEVRRPPSGDAGSIRVDCPSTRYIGVAFQLQKADPNGRDIEFRPNGTSQHTMLRFQWQHDKREVSGKKYDVFKKDNWVALATAGTRFYLDTIELGDDDRVDGTWTVSVRHRGHLLYQESFLLSDCDKPYQPDWFDKQDDISGD